jgi:hypothetical protein
MARTPDEIERIRCASDYYKAVFGCRPRAPYFASDAEEEEFLLKAYDNASNEMKRRKSTPAGRNALRADGWVLDGDPTNDGDYREAVC